MPISAAEKQAIGYTGGSLTDEQTFKLARHRYETTGADTQFNGGLYSDFLSGAGEAGKFARMRGIQYGGADLFPDEQQRITTGIQQASDIFKQATGQDIKGDALNTITQHIRQGDTVEQAVKNLGGNLANWTKFSSDYGGIQSASQLQPQDNLQVTSIGAAPGEANPADPFNTGRTYTSNFDPAKGGYVFNNQGGIEWVAGTAAQAAQPTTQGGTGLPEGASATKDAVHTLKAYDTTNNFAEVWVKPGQYVPGMSLYPKKTSGITADSLQEAEQITLPDLSGVEAYINADASVISAMQNVMNIMDAFAASTTPAQEQQKSFLDDILGAEKEKASLFEDKLQMEEDAGIAEMNTQLSDIMGQIKTKEAEFNNYRLAMEGKPVTMGTITGNIAQRKNQIAGEIIMLQADAQILQGKMSAAQENIDKAIDLMFATEQSKIDIYQAQLNALAPQLSREEKVLYDKQQVLLDYQRQALEDAKAEERVKNGVGITGDRDTQIVTAGGRQILVDKQTGETIRDLGGAYKPTTTSTSAPKTTTQDLVNEIQAGLQQNNAFGEDGKMAWESYLWAYQNWVNNGKSQSSFTANFPPNQYLDEGNLTEFNRQLGK